MQYTSGVRWVALLVAALGGAIVALFAVGSPVALHQMWDDACRGFCAKGTQCEQGSCRPAPLAPVVQPKSSRRAAKKQKRVRKRPKGQQRKLPWTNDRHIPRFDANAIQQIDAGDDSGRLDQLDIDNVLANLQPAWERCVQRADTRAGGELPEGRVHLSFGVKGTGKVTGVNARAPKGLAKFGILPCVRVAVFAARFPAYRGPETRVESHFDVAF